MAIIVLIASSLPLHSYAQDAQLQLLTPAEAKAIYQTWEHPDWMYGDYYVYGIATQGLNINEGQISGCLSLEGTALYMYRLDASPDILNEVAIGDTLYIVSRMHAGGWSTKYETWDYRADEYGMLENGSVVEVRRSPHIAYGNAATLYDFDGDGLKEAADGAERDSVEIAKAISPLYFDLNNDGRTDYIDLTMSMWLGNGISPEFGDIHYQLPDGSYRTETMWVMTWDEYKEQMTYEELATLNDPSTYSLGNVTHFCASLNFSGASLARAPKRAPQKSLGLGYVTAAPTKAVDLNNDGLIDLIDEKSGVIYTNMGNSK